MHKNALVAYNVLHSRIVTKQKFYSTEIGQYPADYARWNVIMTYDLSYRSLYCYNALQPVFRWKSSSFGINFALGLGR